MRRIAEPIWVNDADAAPGGVVSAAMLRRHGVTRRDRRAALADGGLVRIRHGWYALPNAESEIVSAVRAGGTLGCVSALAWHGIWTPRTGLHLRFSEHGRRMKHLGTTRCACRTKPGPAPVRAVQGVLAALVCAVGCAPDDYWIAMADSAINRRQVEHDQLVVALRDRGQRVRRMLARIDPRSQSGSESLSRIWLHRARVPHDIQVEIPGVGRVDGRIGTSLIFEIDSRAHHTGETNYRTDRWRDLQLIERGYTVVRFTYEQIVDDWSQTLALIRSLVRQGVHRRRVRTAGLPP